MQEARVHSFFSEVFLGVLLKVGKVSLLHIEVRNGQRFKGPEAT